MSPARLQLLLIKGALADLPPEDQQKIQEMAAKLREVLAGDKAHGYVALGLIGAEAAAEEEG